MVNRLSIADLEMEMEMKSSDLISRWKERKETKKVKEWTERKKHNLKITNLEKLDEKWRHYKKLITMITTVLFSIKLFPPRWCTNWLADSLLWKSRPLEICRLHGFADTRGQGIERNLAERRDQWNRFKVPEWKVSKQRRKQSIE